MVGRLVERVGCGGGRRAGPVRDRLGDLGVDPVSRRLLRRHRPAPHLRPGEPPRRHGAELDDGQAGSARAHGRGLRARARRDRAARIPSDPSALGRPLRVRPPIRRTARRYRIGMLRGTLDEDAAGGPPELRGVARACCGEIADVEEGLELPDYPYDAMAATRDRRRGGERVRAAVRERPDHRAHRARGPDRRLRGAGGAGQGLHPRPPGAAAGGGGAGPRCWRRWTPSPRRRCRPWRGRSTPRSTRSYPDYPGGASIGGAANLCGVPGLFLMNGTGEGGLPTSLQLTGRALGEGDAARDRHVATRQRTNFHRLRSAGIVTRARPRLYLG